MGTETIEETWKPLDDFEGLYEVSNLGNVRSVDHQVRCNSGVKTVRGRILKPCDRGNSYPFVTCRKNGKQYNVSVHRAVAIAFIPNPFGLPEVNHKDCDTFNSHADNLEWCDRTYNNTYNGRAKAAAKKRWKEVQQIRNGEVVGNWESLTKAGEMTGFAIGNISACCAGKRKKAYGYEWRYREV